MFKEVEQRTENPCVAGSIPARTTKKLQRNLELFCVIRISSKVPSQSIELVKFLKTASNSILIV